MICPACGRKTKETGLCTDCFLKRHPIKIRDITVKVCRCGRFWRNAKWEHDLDSYLETMIREGIITDPEARITDVSVEPVFEEKRIRAKATLWGVYKGDKFIRELSKDIKKETHTCPICSRISSSYYEAVVQFRIPVDARKVLDGEYVSRTEKVAGGFDAYLTSAPYARKLGSMFARKGYIVVHSKQVAGMKDGVEMSREYVAIKSPGVEEGDFIRYKGNILQIKGFGKTIKTQDISRKKTLMIPPKAVEKADVAARKSDIRTAMVSSISPATVQFMDRKDYSTFELPNRYPELKEKDAVNYVQIMGKIYLL